MESNEKHKRNIYVYIWLREEEQIALLCNLVWSQSLLRIPD